jgi:endonuclease/exonuclease/phosphatase family metal-dependent hydrolase
MRVVTLNIGGLAKYPDDPYPACAPARAARLRLYVRDADILIVNEANDMYNHPHTLELLQAHTGHPYMAWARTSLVWFTTGVLRGYGGIGILSRLPFAHVWRHQLGPRPLPLQLLHARLQRQGQMLDIIPVHYPFEQMAAYTGFIRRVIGSIPGQNRLIVGGDFNAPADALLDRTYLTNAFREGDYWPAGHHHIDWILVRGFEVTAHRVEMATWSEHLTDHFAIKVDVEAAAVPREPAECAQLRTHVITIERDVAAFNRRWKALVEHKPIPWDEVNEIKHEIARLNAEARTKRERAVLIGCLPFP